MRKGISILFILTIMGASLNAQHIKGVITDSATRQPLAWATISLYNSIDTTTLKMIEGSPVKSTLSKEDGSYLFELLTPGNYLLSVQMMGYSQQLIHVSLTTDTIINIRL